MQEKAMRNSNIELLRIILAFMVVILHFNNEGIGMAFTYTYGTTNYKVLEFLEILSISAVNTFVLISGFFSVRRNEHRLRDSIRLILMTIILQFAAYLIRVYAGIDPFWIGGIKACFLITNYYVILFIALTISSPYINLMLNHLSNKGLRNFIILLVLTFSVYPYLTDVYEVIIGYDYWGFSTIGMYGSGKGYSFVNFFLCYCIGAALERLERTKGDTAKGARGFCCAAILYAVGITGVLLLSGFNADLAWEYCNPLVISNAACLFWMFRCLHIRSSRVINTLAKASFPCFILHISAFPLLNIAEITSRPPTILVLSVLGVCVLFYSAAFCINTVIQFFMQPVWKQLQKCSFAIHPQQICMPGDDTAGNIEK